MLKWNVSQREILALLGCATVTNKVDSAAENESAIQSPTLAGTGSASVWSETGTSAVGAASIALRDE